MKKKIYFIALPVVIVAVLSAVWLFTRDAGAVSDAVLKQSSPTEILQVYISALNTGDYNTLNKVLSKRYLDGVNDGEGYQSLPAVELTNISIAPFTAEGYGAAIAERYTNVPESECHYVLSYLIKDSDGASWFIPGEEGYYFVKLLLEDDIWKIDAMATSP